MLAKEKICSTSFVVMHLRTKEIDSRSSNSRERTHGNPTGEFYTSLVQFWSTGDGRHSPCEQRTRLGHGSMMETAQVIKPFSL